MNAFTQTYFFGNTALDPERQRKVAIYGRVSTQHEAQIDALGNQMQWYDDQMKYHPNWQVIDRYIDEGITGTLAKKRPAFMRMVDDAKRGRFDLIVTREVCRFARNTVDTLMVTRDLKNYGVEVFFVSDNIRTMDGDGELRLTIMATMAQEESRKISERVRAGQATSRANHVLYGNGNIIGYDRVGPTYVINEEQAETIRTVYTLYSQGLGEKAIVNELGLLGCKDGRGKVCWSCAKVSRILRNKTYMGMIGYRKSAVNNFLEKKRINNLDEDSIEYVEGDFEPIISEELWTKCEKIRKGRITKWNMPNGMERRKGTRAPKLLWVSKLRCRCGGSYNRFKWRTLADGTDVYGYQCAVRTQNPTRSFVLATNMEQTNSCDAISIPQWKLELMAKAIFDCVWGDQKEAVMKACAMIKEAQRGAVSMAAEQKTGLEEKIEKLKTRKRKFSTMYADGDLSREEYKEMVAQADEKIHKLEDELSAATMPQPDESVQNANHIQRALEEIVDISSPKIDDNLIDRFVEVVTPVENYSYRWKLNFGEKVERKDRTNLCEIATTPILKFTITFEDAKVYRKANNMPTQFRSAAWTDLNVEVYI